MPRKVVYRKKRGTSKLVKRAYKNERRYPSRFFGTSYTRRGDPNNLAMYGPTRSTATDDQKLARSATGYVGKGGYWGHRLGDWMSSASGVAGLGSTVSNIENSAARGAAGFLNRYSGSGSYNSLMNPDGMDIPDISQSGVDASSVTLRHREFVCDVVGSSIFSNTSFAINPGNSTIFPWMSQIANQYDEYQFNQLIFGYKSVTADTAVATTQIGSVIMVATTNVNSGDFKSKIPMMEYESAVSCRVTDNCTFGVECDPAKGGLGPVLYVAPNGNVPVGEDVKTYYLGNFQIAVNQCLNSGEIGELWVEYDITLRKKKMFSSLGNGNVVVGIISSGLPTQNNCFGSLASGSIIQKTLFDASALNVPPLTPITYVISSLGDDKSARTAAWTPALAKSYWCLWVPVTQHLIVYIPENVTGSYMFSIGLATGSAGSTVSGFGIVRYGSSPVGFGSDQLPAIVANGYGAGYVGCRFDQSALSAGTGGATGTSNCVVIPMCFNGGTWTKTSLVVTQIPNAC